MADDPDLQHSSAVLRDLTARFGVEAIRPQETRDSVPTFWTPAERAHEILAYLKEKIERPYRTLFDLTAIDERHRSHRRPGPTGDFTIVYHLLSYDRADDIRIKVALSGDTPTCPTVAPRSAGWP